MSRRRLVKITFGDCSTLHLQEDSVNPSNENLFPGKKEADRMELTTGANMRVGRTALDSRWWG